MKIARINPDGVFNPGTYSHVVKAGNTLYISGQVGRDTSGHVPVGDIRAQTEIAFQNLGRCLASQQIGLDRVVMLTIYVVGRENVPTLLEAFPAQFPRESQPACTVLMVAGLARPEMLVEVEAVAVLPEA